MCELNTMCKAKHGLNIIYYVTYCIHVLNNKITEQTENNRRIKAKLQ